MGPLRLVSLATIAAMLLPYPAGAAQAGPTTATPLAVTPAPAQQAPAPPNVLVWMMDDVGFAQLSSYGGLVPTPNIDRVASRGLRYDNYHTAAVCSASRAALLTGRMPHSVNMGGHAAIPMPFPGYDGQVPAGAGTVAENLKQAGYATFAVGKWDHLPTSEVSPAGPFTHWPLQQGFERYYGYLAADTDNWHPNLVQDNAPAPTPQTPGYHLSADLADRAIAMIRSRDGRAPAAPFFLYWATGAAHAPLHAPREWIERFRGKFDMGWDQAREDILRRQIAMGLQPRGTRLSPRPPAMPAWSSLSADQKRMYARQMEVFAAALAYADAQFGRILDELERRGELDNTMVVVVSDNGASGEGGEEGKLTEAFLAAQREATLAENLKFYDRWGGPETYPTYNVGWAVAGDTPFRYYKQTTYEGGQRVPLVVSWPRAIAATGELRRQYVYVADIAPTILQAAGVKPAAMVNNVPQEPMEGISFAATFTAPGSPRDGRPQYSEMFGNRSMAAQGWSIVANHRMATWRFDAPPTFNEPWELYDLVKDPGQTTDLAAKMPGKVAELARLFDAQAARYHVLPSHNQSEGMPEMAKLSAAQYAARGGVWRYSGPVSSVPGLLAPPILSRSFRMTARLDVPAAATTGPIFAQGSTLGGMALYLDQGRPVLLLSQIDGAAARIAAPAELPDGTTELTLDVDRGPRGADGRSAFTVRIGAAGKLLAEQVVQMQVDPAVPLAETFAIGRDDAAPMLAGYPASKPLAAGLSDVRFDFNR